MWQSGNQLRRALQVPRPRRRDVPQPEILAPSTSQSSSFSQSNRLCSRRKRRSLHGSHQHKLCINNRFRNRLCGVWNLRAASVTLIKMNTPSVDERLSRAGLMREDSRQ